MPSVSQKQHNLMAMVANDPAAAKRLGISQSVGQEFMQADKGRKFGAGNRPDRQRINKPNTEHGKSALFAKGGDMKESKAMVKKEIGFMKKAGAPKSMIKHEAAEMGAMNRGGGVKKMAGGGDTTMSNPSRERKGMTMEKMGKVVAGGKRPHGEHTVQQKGHTRALMPKMAGGKGMKRGGKC